ncbi:MAG: response regulator transcription factor [Oscillospiraceae bacterium]|nr:response regulator transcription factor [Oscillospiraceae bacterium]
MNKEMDHDGYLLLIEDEPTIQAVNKQVLTRRGYVLRQAYTLAEARKLISEEPPQAIILDIQLPDGNGLDFLSELREGKIISESTDAQHSVLNSRLVNIPVLMLTAMGTRQDIINGLESGGDDYLTKPYELSVFLARVQALLRRAAYVPNTLQIGPIKLDIASNRASINGEDMEMPQKEISLLEQFLQYPSKTMSAEFLYEKVWGQKMFGDETALKVAISKLRTKLAGSGYTITASRGEGYYFERE